MLAETLKVSGSCSPVRNTFLSLPWTSSITASCFRSRSSCRSMNTFSTQASSGCSRLSSICRSLYLFSEAHPFLLHNKSPGSGNFWTKKKDHDLGVRASGTNTQLWMRYELITRAAAKT